MFDLTNTEKEQLMHKLYKTLTVLPLSSLLTEDNLKNVVYKTTRDVVTTADKGTYVRTEDGTFKTKDIKAMSERFYPLNFAPIIVNQCVDGSYYIAHGWDRLLAAQAMGWTTIPCFVLQILCGEEYVKLVDDDSWEYDRGFYSYSDIQGELSCANNEELLKVLG
jgi:hypothetical protein